MRKLQNVLVTGGAGFIGANFIHYLLAQPQFSGRVINLDALTYAGNLDNLVQIDRRYGAGATPAPANTTGGATPNTDRSGAAPARYVFERADIRDFTAVTDVFKRYEVDTVVHFAAESHVDRSIVGPRAFIETNVNGTFNLLEAARAAWADRDDVLFHHVSTDEVFGSLGAEGAFSEETPYDPKSPYSASKASSDHLVRAHGHTFGLPFTISNCSNNYGPYQFPEKMVPLMILNALERKDLPVYGDGRNVRDWLYVEDHSAAIWTVLQRGATGETYLVGGENEWENIRLVRAICEKVAAALGEPPQRYTQLIRFVKDRPGHDQRYAVNCGKIKRELGWHQRHEFSSGLDSTIAWYRDNPEWVQRVRSGAYKDWIEANYAGR